MGLFTSKKNERKGEEALKKMGLSNKTEPAERGKDLFSGGEWIVDIPVDRIGPNPAQPRKHFNEEKLRNMAESMKGSGVLQPVLVRKADTAGEEYVYQLVSGERRLRAAKLAGLSVIPAVVRDVKDSEMRRFAIVENIQREDLSIPEKTRAIGELAGDANDLKQVAAELGLSRRIVERYLRIYRVIHASETLASVFERQAEHIDFNTAETMATLFETIEKSESHHAFIELVNTEGIKSAIKHFKRVVGGSRASRKTGDFFNIVVRKDELVITARYPKDKELTSEDRKQFQKGFRQFFKKLDGSGKNDVPWENKRRARGKGKERPAEPQSTSGSN